MYQWRKDFVQFSLTINWFIILMIHKARIHSHYRWCEYPLISVSNKKTIRMPFEFFLKQGIKSLKSTTKEHWIISSDISDWLILSSFYKANLRMHWITLYKTIALLAAAALLLPAGCICWSLKPKFAVMLSSRPTPTSKISRQSCPVGFLSLSSSLGAQNKKHNKSVMFSLTCFDLIFLLDMNFQSSLLRL